MVQDNTTGTPLCAGSLARFMAMSLPRSDSPQLRNPTEAVALAVHAGMLAVGFRLTGLGEDDAHVLIDAHADAHDARSLPPQWNASASDHYAFRYAHAQSAMQYLVKVSRLGSQTLVYGLAVGADKTTHFHVPTNDYVSPSHLPLHIPPDTSTADAATKLQDVFLSAARLHDLGSLLNMSIVQKLAPGLSKGAAEESHSSRSHNQRPVADQPAPGRNQPRHARDPPTEPAPARPHPFDDPLAVRPQGNRPLPEPMPGFEDEHEILRRPPGGLRDDRYPIGIGHDDLYPQGLGPNDPFRPHLGPGVPRPGGGFGGGGMHPTFDDPLFRGQGGAGGYDARAPPGARYDPMGPGDPLRDDGGGGGGGRFPGGGGFGGMGERPPNPFGGFSDSDFI
ncbi:hypothetical protein ACEQ8H_006452 [Pleosporales sp. CAS-2024a]